MSLDFEPEPEFALVLEQEIDHDYIPNILEPEVEFEQEQEIDFDNITNSYKRDIELLRGANRHNASPHYTRNSLEPEVVVEQERNVDIDENTETPQREVALEQEQQTDTSNVPNSHEPSDRNDGSPPPYKRRRIESPDKSITSKMPGPEASAALIGNCSSHDYGNYFRITIHWTLGVLTHVYVEPTSTIADVKAAICRSQDIPPVQQQLKKDYEGDELQDDQTMSEAGIKSGQKLELQLFGGVFAPPGTANDLTVTPVYPHRCDFSSYFRAVVKDWYGHVCPTWIYKNWTAGDIKHSVANQTSVPPCRQRVYLKGKLLKGEDSVEDASILRQHWIYVKLGPCEYATRPQGCDVHGKASASNVPESN